MQIYNLFLRVFIGAIFAIVLLSPGIARATHLSFSCSELNYSGDFCGGANFLFTIRYCSSFDQSTNLACIDDTGDGSFITACSSACSSGSGCDHATFNCVPCSNQVAGRVFFDLNENGVYDPPSEFGLNSSPVRAVPPPTASYPPAITSTGANGIYLFSNLCGSIYDIIVDLPPNTRMSSAFPSNSRRVGLPPDAFNINFGIVPLTTPIPTPTFAPLPTPPPGSTPTIAPPTATPAGPTPTSGPTPTPIPCAGPPPLIGCADGTTEQYFGVLSSGKSVHGCNGAVSFSSAQSVCAACWAVGDVVNDSGLGSLLGSQASSPPFVRWIRMNGDPGNVTATCGPNLSFWGIPNLIICDNLVNRDLRPVHLGNWNLYYNGVLVLGNSNGNVHSGTAGAICIGSPPVPTATPTPTPTPVGPTATLAPTPTAAPGCTSSITGRVIRDSVFENCSIDLGEIGHNGASVLLSGSRSTATAGNGNYSFANLCAGSYIAALTIPFGFRMSACSSRSITTAPIPPSTIANFFIVPLVVSTPTPTRIPPTPTPTPIPTFNISGIVYVDTNENRARDLGEQGFGGASITATGPTPRSATTTGAGNYLLPGLLSGSYSVRLTVPAGHFATTVNPRSVFVPPTTSSINFGIAPMHSISGNVFVDTNNSKLKDGAEVNYSLGTSTIQVRRGGNCSGSQVTPPSPINTPNGTFTTGNVLTSGQYTLCYMNIPLGYVMTFPLGQIGRPHIILDVGFPCSGFPFDSIIAGTCDALGNITNANFGINFANPWFSSRGVDLRVDSGFDDIDIPASAIPPYASLDGTGGMPGVIFSGDENADFGPFGQASSRRWVVGSFSFPELYTPSQLNTIKTSYSYLLAVANKSSLVPLSISAACGGNISNCNLNLPADPGLFIANGPLTIVNLSYTIPSNQDYVILVNGDLTLRGEIHVPVGSTLTFSVKGDIIVDRTVGSPASSATPDIEGLYSADGDFITGGNDDCAIGPDLRLNIAGTIVTNAALSGGSLIKQRDLCVGNVANPAVYITERPDFVLNSPLLIQSTQTIWQEVAP